MKRSNVVPALDARGRRTRGRRGPPRPARRRARSAAARWCPGASCRWTSAISASSVRRGSITTSARAAQRGLPDARAGDRVGLGDVGADHEQQVGALDVGERVGGGAGAERGAHAGGRRRVAHARAAVDVVGAEPAAEPLLEAGSSPRWCSATTTARRRAPRSRANSRATQRDRLVPARSRLSRPSRRTSGVRQAVGMAHEAVRVAALDAQVAVVHRRAGAPSMRRIVVAGGVHVELAADAAVAAGVRTTRPCAARRGARRAARSTSRDRAGRARA